MGCEIQVGGGKGKVKADVVPYIFLVSNLIAKLYGTMRRTVRKVCYI